MLFLISTCAAADVKCEGFFTSTKKAVECYCSPLYSSPTHLLAKCALCSLARFQDIGTEKFELAGSEMELLQVLLSLAAKDDDGDCSVWDVYTLTTAHYLHLLLFLCYRFALSEHNAKLFAESAYKETTVFDILNIVFEFHTEDSVLRNALLFLEAMIRQAKLLTISAPLISAVKRTISSSTSSDVQENAYFCILALELEKEVTYETGKSIHVMVTMYVCLSSKFGEHGQIGVPIPKPMGICRNWFQSIANQVP